MMPNRSRPRRLQAEFAALQQRSGKAEIALQGPLVA
jgi:hypothetical protein